MVRCCSAINRKLPDDASEAPVAGCADGAAASCVVDGQTVSSISIVRAKELLGGAVSGCEAAIASWHEALLFCVICVFQFYWTFALGKGFLKRMKKKE